MKLKILALSLAVILLASGTALAVANAAPDAATPVTPLPDYLSVSGKVSEIVDSTLGEGYYFVHVKDADGETTVFSVSPNSCNITGKLPVAGDAFTGYYDTSLPVPLIYPPQYQAAAFSVNPDEKYTVKVSRFDEEFLSTDGELVIHIGDDTVLLQANGDAFVGGADALVGRALVVLYTASTRSLPPQTTPEKIFVLYEQAVPLEGDMGIDALSIGILVNGKIIEAPESYFKDTVLMVPLRAIAEALGYEVDWVGETRSVTLDGMNALSIGKDSYALDKAAPLALGTAPEIVNRSTFVPLSFFKRVVGMNNAYFFEGVVEINNDEPME